MTPLDELIYVRGRPTVPPFDPEDSATPWPPEEPVPPKPNVPTDTEPT